MNSTETKACDNTMKTRLVSYRNGRIDLAFPLEEKRVTIGRDVDNLIQLPHEKVSKHHAILLQTQDGWAIEDLRSSNGILVNGQRVERATLRDGDLVKIGGYEMYFETNVPSDDWIPSYIIDLSSQIHDPTASKTTPPEQS